MTDLLISNADREKAIGRLQHFFAEGRLSENEMDERISEALRARRDCDLIAVMRSLPEVQENPSGYTDSMKSLTALMLIPAGLVIAICVPLFIAVACSGHAVAAVAVVAGVAGAIAGLTALIAGITWWWYLNP